ncbi:MAG: BamA/TamA family outer membrane protein [Desulfuromusa sp.]|nr:BamA/TamA family outer membrane protein [Desulfuromusa sp.]
MKFQLYLITFCLCLLPVCGSAESLYLNIQGVDSKLQKILNKALVLPSSLTRGENINHRLLQRYQKQLPELVSGILEPYGYFHSQVSSLVEPIEAGEYQLNIDINPAEPLRVTHLNLNLTGPGADLPKLRQLLESFPLHVGDILRQDFYEEGKTELLQGAANLGYLDAEFQQHQILVNRGNRQVDIILELNSGVRFRFGKTVFMNHGNYTERFLHRYISYKEGDFFSQSQLDRTHRNLLDADQFRNISINKSTHQNNENLVPIQIDLQPAPRYRLRPGIGYGTDTGARASLEYRRLNMFHRGHELEGKLVLAEKESSFLSTYIIPDLDRLDRRTLLRAGVTREEPKNYTSKKKFGEVEYQRSLRKGLSGAIFIRLLHEDYEVSDESDQALMLLPGLRLNWLKSDDEQHPRRRIHIKLNVQGCRDTFISDISLLQLTGQATALEALTHDLSLFLRLGGGTTWHEDPFGKIPASLRFFAGGDHSVRGYSYQSLGPENDQGDVIGGKHLLVANIEIEKHLSSNWGVAVFYDIGNAFDTFSDYELKQGAGVGAIYRTMIGSLRLYLARQIGTTENKYRLHFSVGLGW